MMAAKKTRANESDSVVTIILMTIGGYSAALCNLIASSPLGTLPVTRSGSWLTPICTTTLTQ